MCGIFLYLFPTGSQPKDFSSIESLIKNRGRDSYDKIENMKISTCPNWSVCLSASVLSTQGNEVTKQPMMTASGSFLLWNGDVFSGPDFTEDCDTNYIFQNLEKYGIEFLLKISGPYSIIYFDSANSKLWFGRDVIGRHSLLYNFNDNSIILSSVSEKGFPFQELPSIGIFKIDLKKQNLELELHPWSHIDPKLYDEFENFKINEIFKHEILGQNPLDYESNEDFPNYLTVFDGEISSEVYLKLVETEVTEVVEEIKNRLFSSVKKRICPNRCRSCSQNCKHAKTAICFSGGLDSTLIALLASRSLPYDEPIDLFNVAFEKSDNFNVPDRIGGLKSFQDLIDLEPRRKWNFVSIDITKNELEEIRKEHIRDLIYPLESILDDSLGCALWFAVRGKGTVEGKNYTSDARVVLLGMGADELFGGYSRHKIEFIKNGWDSLGRLLRSEIRNIGKRNLGRDNRVAADHCRQPRIPFLDEDFYSFVDKLPPWKKTYLSPNLKKGGIGDKYLLRLLAYNLGLKYAATAPKKALQFGSRIANSSEKGHQKSERL